MAGIGLLARLFGGDPFQRDGQAAALEAHAAGIGPALDATNTAGGAAGSAGSRRQRPLEPPHESLTESLAEKVLNAWLQNRHQTLYPLAVNLRTLDAGRVVLLARMMAVTLLAGARAPAERTEAALDWLGQAGGDDAVRRALVAALDAPEPLGAVLREVQDAGLTAYAYVVALVATDPRDDAGQLFLDYLAVRLVLPATVVRSADRRYRRHSSASVRAFSAP